MLFNEFGKKGNPVILGIHGMCQNWKSEYEMLKPLENILESVVVGLGKL